LQVALLSQKPVEPLILQGFPSVPLVGLEPTRDVIPADFKPIDFNIFLWDSYKT
jgi:hypothetical protein